MLVQADTNGLMATGRNGEGVLPRGEVYQVEFVFAEGTAGRLSGTLGTILKGCAQVEVQSHKLGGDCQGVELGSVGLVDVVRNVKAEPGIVFRYIGDLKEHSG